MCGLSIDAVNMSPINRGHGSRSNSSGAVNTMAMQHGTLFKPSPFGFVCPNQAGAAGFFFLAGSEAVAHKEPPPGLKLPM